MYFKSNLKYLRMKAEISQSYLAKQLCVSRNQISNYENGISEPHLELLIKISRYFNYTVDEMVLKNLSKQKNYTYQQLLDMGFVREDMNDDVLFLQSGYHGYCLVIEFPKLGTGISTVCPANKSTWTFNQYNLTDGKILGEVAPGLLSEVIRKSKQFNYRKAS